MDTPAARPSQGCKYHPPLPAKSHCKRCNAPLCSACIKFIGGNVLCEDCADKSRKSSGIVLRPVSKPVPPEAYAKENLAPKPAELESEAAARDVRTHSKRFTSASEEKLAAQIYYCRNHPERIAEKKCDLCGGVFCADCVKDVRKRQLCTGCARPAGITAMFSRLPVERQKTFFERLPGAFLYPLMFERKYLLFGGMLFIWLGFIVHWGIGLAVCAGILLWLMKIVRVTARNDEYESTFPSLKNARHDLVRPFGHLLFGMIVSLIPALVYISIFNPGLMDYKTVIGRAQADQTLKILLLVAALLLPYALCVLAMFGRITVLTPPMLVQGLFRLAPYYLPMLAILAAGFVPAWFLYSGAESVLGLIGTFLIQYSSIVAFHVFGLAYAARKEAFAWVGLPLVGAEDRR